MPAEPRPVILTATHIPTGDSVFFELKGERFRLGRASSEDPKDKLTVPFDPKLSRRLAVLEVKAGVLQVERDESRYPLFHEGQEKDQFELSPGQRFSSGETVFELQERQARTLTVRVMDEVNQGSPGEILKVLLGLQSLLNRWHEPADLAARAVELLKELLPEAQVAFYQLGEGGDVEALSATTLMPSRSLVAECIEEKLPAYHVWSPTGGTAQPTQFGDESWALAAPILSSAERLVLYAVGRQSHTTPGDLERSALALVAQILSQHLEGRRSLVLATQVDAQARANSKLRVLLETIERSLSLQQQDGYQKVFLDGARLLTGAEVAHFELDLAEYLEDEQRTGLGQNSEGSFLAVAFERSWPSGILCTNPPTRGFLPDDEGWLVALMGFAETVFENRRLHQQVRASLTQLKESQAQMVRTSQWVAAGRLAANAAHELNTPLGAIKLSTEAALSFLRDGPEPAHKSLQLALRSVERCKKVTERFLVYSRPKEEKKPEAFSLAEVVEDSLSSLNPFLKGKTIETQVSVAPDLQVLGDSQDTYWAVTNLLKNAAEALAEYEERARHLLIAAETSDDLILLCVEDSGPGIPEGLRAKVFEPFFSTKKIGEGNGLGLAISRRNVRSWGGDLCWKHSDLGGAGFLLTLPRSG